MKAIHNYDEDVKAVTGVVLYPKDTQNWKQFTTYDHGPECITMLCYILKILKIESNSQLATSPAAISLGCVIS